MSRKKVKNMSRGQQKAVFYKIKNGKQQKIKKPKSIDNYLDRGYTISKVTEEGNKTKITTYSPRTRYEYFKARGSNRAD